MRTFIIRVIKSAAVRLSVPAQTLSEAGIFYVFKWLITAYKVETCSQNTIIVIKE